MDRVNAAIGFAAGAALMYAFDPILGRRRRATTRNKAFRTWKTFLRGLGKAQRDAGNRAQGWGAGVGSLFSRAPADDQVLIERLRSGIGRVVSHSHAIHVSRQNGRVVLEGPVLEQERDALLREVRSIFDPAEVVNRLQVHRDAENVPALQGGIKRTRRSELTQQNWTPALRAAAIATGTAMVLTGLRGRNAQRWTGILTGAALLTRALSNREFRQIIGMGAGARTIEFDKTVHINAPVEEVFRFWSNHGNFPRFMTHLKEVRDLGNGRSHWVAEGPGGLPVSWEAELTENIPNRLLRWRSVPGSRIETEGTVRFDQNADGCTRVSIRLFYTPPAGLLGHFAASLLGADPKHEIDDDMVRLKSLIENGKTRAHKIRVTREELSSAGSPVPQPR